ncbi:alpha/beta-hydrolase [Lentinus tigrinus ALCF2SS1-7]|uniref:Alpha/beta-hydrolase n=1 Tax=Lentinus tigrinus ALCF2SS1-6 TaxID=1328759 RepID=A0A5C2RZX9_9APHY|nr:alpha/beta-hydrolase [Lentinus tigrinus ALCF2SS1-6]RPD79543.1 alpha/beta-hydrolase [Lentinus tigrinus ALCF2SS1-7]
MSNLLPSIESFAKGTVATAAGLSTVGFGLLFFGQNYLIYPSAFPPGSRTEVPVPTDFDLPYQDLPLTTPDGVKLRCYLLTQRKELPNHGAKRIHSPEEETDEQFAARRPTILMFHGNGGNVGHRIPLAKVFYVRLRCNVLMLSYRGYGLSEGNPSEKGIRIDAQCALDHVLSHEYLSQTPVILYGQSIGGAVSIDLASRNPHAIRALILENTFLSLPRLVPSAMPVLGPFAFLCHQKWDSASKIPTIPAETPMLLLSGVRDEVVPREHMQELWQLVQQRVPRGQRDLHAERNEDGMKDENVKNPGAGAQFSRFVEFHAGTHNDTCIQQGYWSAIANFLDSLDSVPPPPPAKV